MIAIHIESALPSLVCLIALCFLPKAARQSLTFWRALQVYAHQEPPVEAPASKSTWSQRLTMLSILSLVAYEFLVLGTSGHDWHETWPIFARIRQSTPALFAMLFVFLAMQSILPAIDRQIIIVRRQHNRKLKAHIPSFTKVSRDSTKPVSETFYSISMTVRCLIFALISVLFAKASTYPGQALRMLSAVSGLIAFTPSIFGNVNLGMVVNNHVSFRGLVILPFLVYGAVLALAFLIVAIVFFCVFVFGEAQDALGKFVSSSSATVPSSAASPAKDWGFQKGNEDLVSVQMLSLFSSFAWTMSLFLPSALICLAYRYDAAQANLATVTEEEAHEIIAQTSHREDKSIQLEAACLPRVALTGKHLSTYKAGLTTLIFVQVIGLLVDALTGWQKAAIYPTSQSQLPVRGCLSTSVWPLLSYPLIVIAMLTSARIQSNSKFKSLWTYHEKWHLPQVEHKGDDAIKKEENIEEVHEVEKQL